MMFEIAITILLGVALSAWAYWDNKQGYIMGYYLFPALLLFAPMFLVTPNTLYIGMATYILLYIISRLGTINTADRISLMLILPALTILNPLALFPFPLVLGVKLLLAREKIIRYIPHLYWAFLSSVCVQVLLYSIGL